MNKVNAREKCQLFAGCALWYARALGGIGDGVGLFRVKEKKTQEFDPGVAAEEFLKGVNHTVKAV